MTHPEDLSALSIYAPAGTDVCYGCGDSRLVLARTASSELGIAKPGDSLQPRATGLDKLWGENRDGVTTRGKHRSVLKEFPQLACHDAARSTTLRVSGADIPVPIPRFGWGKHGPVLVVGRDLRAVAAIQQRFVETQRGNGTRYWQQRQAESRYRRVSMLQPTPSSWSTRVDAGVVDAISDVAVVDLALDNIIGKSAVLGSTPTLVARSRNAGDRSCHRPPAEIRARHHGKKQPTPASPQRRFVRMTQCPSREGSRHESGTRRVAGGIWGPVARICLTR